MQDAFSYIDKESQNGNRNIKLDDVFDSVKASADVRKAFGQDVEKQLKYFNSLPKNINATTKAIDRYNDTQAKAGETGIKTTTLLDDVSEGLSGVGKTLLSMGTNAAIDLGVSFMLQKAGEKWDEYSNKQENAIEKGNEALDNYKQTNQEMQSATSWVEENGERFTELSQKATQLGEQGKLTNSEFQEYNQLSAQAAEYFPKLVTGYNSENTPITSLGKSANSLDEALSTEKLNRYTEAADSAKDVISKFKAEMYQDKTDITKETGITNQMDAISSFLDGYDNNKENPFESLSNAVTPDEVKKATVNYNNLQEAMENAGVKASGLFGQYKASDFTNPDNVQTLRNYYEDLQSQAENSVSAIKEVMPAFFQEQADYQKLIGKNSNLDTEIGTMLTGLTQDSIERIIGGSVNDMSDDEVVAGIRNWSKKLVNNLQDQDTQDAFDNLFSVNDDKSSLSFQDYEKKATDAVDAVAKKTNAFTKDELKQQSGITDSLDEMQTAYNNISDRFGKDKGFSEDYVKNQLSASDMLTLGTMATDDMYKDLSYNDALEKITVAKRQNELSVSNLQKSVDTITSQYSTVSSAIQESMSDTGLTQDSITAIKNSVKDVIDSSEELKDFDLDGLFTNTSKGVKLNNSQLENLLDIQNDIKEQDFDESIDQQTEALEKQTKEAEALKKQYGETSDEYVNALEKQKQAQEDLNATQQAQSQYYAQYQQQKQLFSDYADWQRATQTENSGDKYLSMVSGLETAKKAFDAGEVGTDDFKTFAKMISPSGATDAVNFAENYGKAARYLTEDESGLLNFFQDLSTKTDAAGEKMAKFNEETQSWELNVHDLGEIAQTLGTGEPLVEALFGRAEDYGATSTVISDMQDGILKSTEATKNWAEAKARLDRMNEENAQAQQEGKDPIYNTTAIQAAEDEVAKYQQQIDGLQESMDYYAEHNLGSEAQQKKIKTAADEISNIQQKMQEAEKNNNETLANAYRNLAKEKAAAAGITVDDDLNVTGNGKTAQEQLQEKSSSGSSSLSGTDFNYDKTSMTLDEIDSKINELQGKRATIDVDVEGEETVNALDTEISALEAQKIQVQIQTAVENGNSLQELLTLSDQQLMTTVGCDASQVDAVRAEIQEMSGESVDLTVAMDSTQFVALINAITGETVEVPVEVETPEVPDVSGETVEYPSKVDTPDVPDVSGEEITYTATVESPDLPDIQGGIAYYTPQIEDSADGETAEGTINYDKGTVESADGETSEGIINYDKGDVEKADGTISTGIINYDLGTVATPTGMVATGVINYTLGSVAKPKATGTFGQARAYAQGNLTDFPAYAGGRVALPKDEKALVNEVGTESIVRDGQWSLIPGGAHLTNLKKGDIIFSASQTEDLLKRGATPGHARAYAQGSLSDLSPLSNAYANPVGGMTLKFGGGLANKTSVSSGSQQATNSNTASTNANTKATDENTSSTKDSTETFNWVKTKLDKFAEAVEHISNQITDYVSSAFKSTLLKRQMSAIDKEITANKQGYDAYMKKANSIGISQDYKNKVANGTFSIEDIDTSTDAGKKLAENIKKYQTYYDAAQDCKDKIQELNNTQLELYETWANMPIEAVEKKIDKIKKKYESLNSFSSATTYGYSAISILTDQINADNPKLKNAASKVTKAENARKETKATRTQAGKNLKSATANAKESGASLIQSAKAQTSSIAKSLKSAAKSSTSKATYSAITSAIRNGTPVSTKGLKGDALKYAKSYNKSLKQQTSISKSVSSGKSVSTTAISSSLQSEAVQYNKDTKAQKSAQKNYNTAKANDEAAAKRLAAAQKNKDEIYSSTTKEQQTLATNKSSKSYVVQNTLLSQETASLREENKARQKALSQTNANVKAQKKIYDKAVKSRDSAGSKLLSTKSVVSSLNKTQKAAIKSGKIVSTKGISNPAVLKALEDYNKKVRNASTENKKFSIQVKAQTDALNEAAQAEANYAETLVANEQKKFENIKNYYEARLQYRQALAEWSEKSQDLSDAHGNYTTSTSYDSQISNLEKERALQQEEAEKLQSQLDKSVSQGKIKKGSEEWLDMKTQIIEAQNAVKDLDTQIENTKQQQITTRYEEMFDRAIDKADKFITKLNSIDDLISDDMKYNSDTGELTEFGALSIALNAKELDSQLDNIRTYVKKRQQIMEDFANGTNESKYGEKTYDELMSENDSNMQNAIKNASSYRDAILNIIKSQAQAVQDALFKQMDAYKKAKQKKKEYYDYDKQLKNKTSEIELLDQQIAALEGVTDAESKAMKAKLEAQRKEKQDDLDDTVRDHVYDLQVNGLDDLKDQLSEDFDKWSKELTSNFEKATDVINNAVNSVGNNTATVMETLAKILKLYGVNPDDLLTSNDLGNLDGYASGTKRVGGVPRLAITNENGREIIATKKGILTPVEPSDGIINHDMTETLMKMASEYQSFHMPEIRMPDVQIVSNGDSSGGNVSIHYDSLLTVQGDVTKDALPDLKTILKQASEYTQNDIRKNRRRFG